MLLKKDMSMSMSISMSMSMDTLIVMTMDGLMCKYIHTSKKLDLNTILRFMADKILMICMQATFTC